jgi:hypothetical protein
LARPPTPVRRGARALAGGFGLFGLGWLITTCDFDPVDSSWYYLPITGW